MIRSLMHSSYKELSCVYLIMLRVKLGHKQLQNCSLSRNAFQSSNDHITTSNCFNVHEWKTLRLLTPITDRCIDTLVDVLVRWWMYWYVGGCNGTAIVSHSW